MEVGETLRRQKVEPPWGVGGGGGGLKAGASRGGARGGAGREGSGTRRAPGGQKSAETVFPTPGAQEAPSHPQLGPPLAPPIPDEWGLIT